MVVIYPLIVFHASGCVELLMLELINSLNRVQTSNYVEQMWSFCLLKDNWLWFFYTKLLCLRLSCMYFNMQFSILCIWRGVSELTQLSALAIYPRCSGIAGMHAYMSFLIYAIYNWEVKNKLLNKVQVHPYRQWAIKLMLRRYTFTTYAFEYLFCPLIFNL